MTAIEGAKRMGQELETLRRAVDAAEDLNMGKIVDSDQYTDNLIAALRSRGVEIPDELLQAASTEASDNTDEVENDDESDYLDPEWGDDDPAGPLADAWCSP